MSDDRPVVEETLEEQYAGILEEHDFVLRGISLALMELAGRVSQLEAERNVPGA